MRQVVLHLRRKRGLSLGSRLATTGGTSFDPVVSHALDRKRRRILVVTDGFARLDPALAARARAIGLTVYVVLFGSRVDPGNALSALPGETWIHDPAAEPRGGPRSSWIVPVIGGGSGKSAVMGSLFEHLVGP